MVTQPSLHPKSKMKLPTRIKVLFKEDFSTPSTTVDDHSRVGCWLVIVAQYFFTAWLSEDFFNKNFIIPLVLGELLFLIAIFPLRAISLIKDMMEISIFNLAYVVAIWVTYEVGHLYYSVLIENWKNASHFFILLATIRLFWSFKVKGTAVNYGWPPFGPIGISNKIRHQNSGAKSLINSILVYVSIFLAAVAAIYLSNAILKSKLMFCLITLGVYLRFFYRQLYCHICTVAELDTAKDELITTKEELAEVAEAKTAAEIELEEQPLANKFSRDQIATLHEFTLMDREMQMRFNNAIRAARAEQLKEEAENELKQKRANLRLVVSDLDDTQ